MQDTSYRPIYDARSAYDTKVMAGVAHYIHEAGDWNVYIEENALEDQRLPDLRTWKGDGIIANFDHPRVAAAVVKSGLPPVGFGSGYGWYPAASEIPYFFTNNQAIAALAADHSSPRGCVDSHFADIPAAELTAGPLSGRNPSRPSLHGGVCPARCTRLRQQRRPPGHPSTGPWEPGCDHFQNPWESLLPTTSGAAKSWSPAAIARSASPKRLQCWVSTRMNSCAA